MAKRQSSRDEPDREGGAREGNAGRRTGAVGHEGTHKDLGRRWTFCPTGSSSVIGRKLARSNIGSRSLGYVLRSPALSQPQYYWRCSSAVEEGTKPRFRRWAGRKSENTGQRSWRQAISIDEQDDGRALCVVCSSPPATRTRSRSLSLSWSLLLPLLQLPRLLSLPPLHRVVSLTTMRHCMRMQPMLAMTTRAALLASASSRRSAPRCLAPTPRASAPTSYLRSRLPPWRRPRPLLLQPLPRLLRHLPPPLLPPPPSPPSARQPQRRRSRRRSRARPLRRRQLRPLRQPRVVTRRWA